MLMIWRLINGISPTSKLKHRRLLQALKILVIELLC